MSTPQDTYSPVQLLDLLVLEVAAAPSGARMLLTSCESCRNRLLYLLDTAPAQDMTIVLSMIRARLRDLPPSHDLFHQNPGAADYGDSRTPQIRWIRP